MFPPDGLTFRGHFNTLNFKAFSIPSVMIVGRMLETSKFLKGLEIFSQIFVKPDTIKKWKCFSLFSQITSTLFYPMEFKENA